MLIIDLIIHHNDYVVSHQYTHWRKGPIHYQALSYDSGVGGGWGKYTVARATDRF